MGEGNRYMFDIRPLDQTFRSWAHDFINREWKQPGIVTRGKLHDTAKLSGFIAVENDAPIGLITFHTEGRECEIVSLNSLKEKLSAIYPNAPALMVFPFGMKSNWK